MTRISMMTIGAALDEGRSIWFQSGSECQRLDSVTWLEAPTANIPKMILDIAKNLGIHAQQATGLARIIEDTDGGRIGQSKSFKMLPLAALDVWRKANELYRTNLHNRSSSGAAHSKLVNGQYIKGKYKPGLISLFGGDKFLAFTSYYMTHGGMRAVRHVQHCMGWNAEKIKEIIMVTIAACNQIKKNFGERGLTWITTHASAGMGFFQMLFAIIQDRSRAKALTIKMKVATTPKKNVAVATAEEDDDEDNEEEVTDAVPAATNGDGLARNVRIDDPDPDDLDDKADAIGEGGEGEAAGGGHVAADGPPIRTMCDEFDNPDTPDDPDDPDGTTDPATRLKMGRELAYELWRQAKSNLSQSERHRELLGAVTDERHLLNALQKGLRPTDLAVAERMTNFISYCWQWAARTGIFKDPEHQKRLDMPVTQIIRQIIHAVQVGYWEVGDNKPADNKKIWIDITHPDRNGHPRVLTLTRPISQLQMKPSGFKGRMIVIKPDAALRECFFQHLPDGKRPSEGNTRFFIVRNEETETITAQRFFHPRGTALTGARSIDDLEDGGQWLSEDTIDAVFDFPDDDVDATIQMVADVTGADADVIRRSMDGDDRAHEIFVHTCRALSEDRKAIIEATFTRDKKEAEVDDATEVPPSILDQNARRNLARLLNLDLGTLEKAFQDDPDSTRALKRAIKNMPEHLRNQAIQKIHRAARH